LPSLNSSSRALCLLVMLHNRTLSLPDTFACKYKKKLWGDHVVCVATFMIMHMCRLLEVTLAASGLLLDFGLLLLLLRNRSCFKWDPIVAELVKKNPRFLW
jgi:hypothetical protein